MEKVKGIVISILIAIFGISTMPFSVYADGDQIIAAQFNTNNIIGTNVTYNTEYYDTSGQYDQYDSVIEFILDDYYIGKIDSLSVTYRFIGSSTDRTISFTNVGVNGTSFTVTIANTGDRVSTANLRITTLQYAGQFYTKSSFLQIFPFESFAIQCFNLSNNPIVGINDQYQYKFNMFKLYGTNNNLFTDYPKMHQFYGYNSQVYTWIFWIDKNIYDVSTFAQYIGTGNNLGIRSVQVVDRFHYDGHTTSIVNVTLVGSANGGNTLKYQNTDDALYMPIYFNLASYQNVSTDFALQFGLDNRLLNALDDISGTVESDQSADNLEDTMSDFTQTSDDVIDVENDIGSGFEDSLNDIPTSFNYNNQFGASFISSSQWVRDQFNNMTVNNPFGSLITFSLILGVGLLLLGRKLL